MFWFLMFFLDFRCSFFHFRWSDFWRSDPFPNGLGWLVNFHKRNEVNKIMHKLYFSLSFNSLRKTGLRRPSWMKRACHGSRSPSRNRRTSFVRPCSWVPAKTNTKVPGTSRWRPGRCSWLCSCWSRFRCRESESQHPKNWFFEKHWNLYRYIILTTRVLISIS